MGEKEYNENRVELGEKQTLSDGNYELPCDPKTLGFELIGPVSTSPYEVPTDAVGSPIDNGSIPVVEDNYELPCHSDSLGSPLQSVSPNEMICGAIFSTSVEGSYEMHTNPHTLGSPLILKSSPYEVPVDSCQSKFPFERGVQTLPSSNQPDGKVSFRNQCASNTLAVMSSSDHNYEEPDFSGDYNYELPTDGIGGNYETPEELTQHNANYDTVPDDVDDTVCPLINIYDAPCN